MFPETIPPTYSERADIIRMEFDVRSPKLRLSIFAYLVEAGIKPGDITSQEAFMELLAHVTEYVSDGVDDYADDVEELQPATAIAQLDLLDDSSEDKNPYDPDGGYR